MGDLLGRGVLGRIKRPELSLLRLKHSRDGFPPGKRGMKEGKKPVVNPTLD